MWKRQISTSPRTNRGGYFRGYLANRSDAGRALRATCARLNADLALTLPTSRSHVFRQKTDDALEAVTATASRHFESELPQSASSTSSSPLRAAVVRSLAFRDGEPRDRRRPAQTLEGHLRVGHGVVQRLALDDDERGRRAFGDRREEPDEGFGGANPPMSTNTLTDPSISLARSAGSSSASRRSKRKPGLAALDWSTKCFDTSIPSTASLPAASAMSAVASPYALPMSTVLSPGLGTHRARRLYAFVERHTSTLGRSLS